MQSERFYHHEGDPNTTRSTQHFLKISFSQQLTRSQQNKVLISTPATTHPPSFPSLFTNNIFQTQKVCADTQLAPLLALLRESRWYQHYAKCLIVFWLTIARLSHAFCEDQHCNNFVIAKLGLDLKNQLCMKTLFQSKTKIFSIYFSLSSIKRFHVSCSDV